MDSKQTKPGIKPQILDGQLVHFVTVGGQPVMGHLSLKAALCAVAFAMEVL